MRDPDEKDPGAQVDPFAADPAKTVIEDPIGDLVTSEEWRNPEKLADCPVSSLKAAHWQEHSFNHHNDAEVPFWATDNVMELARFPVPPGMQGRATVLETAALGFEVQPELDPEVVFNFSCMYPDYYSVIVGVPPPITPAGIKALTFYLRLESWRREGLPGAARLLPDRGHLPGVAYSSLGQWSDTRYDYMRKKEPSLLVSEGLYLTLWCEIVARDISRLMGLWGRLGGMVQSYRDNPQAIDESRRWRQH